MFMICSRDTTLSKILKENKLKAISGLADFAKRSSMLNIGNLEYISHLAHNQST